MLNFHKLDVFLQVVESGSFSRAAQSLLMTQSAVSHHMRDLEIQLGTSLFDRGPRGVTLTASGEVLKEYVLKITALVAEAERAVTNVENLKHGAIDVAATPGVSAYLLPDCIFSFRTKYANLSVSMLTGTSDDVIDLLRSTRIDLGILEGELEAEELAGLNMQSLQQIEQMVIIGLEHPWQGRSTIALDELNGQEFVMRQPRSRTRIWLDQELAQHAIVPRVSTVFDNVDSIKRSVIRGQGIAIMPDYSVKAELEQGSVEALSIEGQPLRRVLKLVWKEGKPLSPPANAFLIHLAECLEAHQPGQFRGNPIQK